MHEVESDSAAAEPRAEPLAQAPADTPAAGRGWPWHKRLRVAVGMAVAPALISAALRVLAATLRTRFVGAEDLFARWARGERLIVACWHGRVLLMPLLNRSPRLCVMNSQSRDGEIATRALARWGIRSVRGSATRGGVGGFLRLVRAYRDGCDLAVIPDGPRGPRCRAKPGVVHLARATGAPLYPASWCARPTLRLRSWDRMMIPLPFAHVVFRVGEPILVPRDAGDDTTEALRVELENRLNDLTREAAAEVGAPGET